MTVLKPLAAGLVAALALTTVSHAGKIKSACNKSDRTVSRSTCSCIQKVADSRLSRSDQKLAAKFFKDPQMAQDVRQSKNRQKESFWLRYKAFGEAAARNCS